MSPSAYNPDLIQAANRSARLSAPRRRRLVVNR